MNSQAPSTLPRAAHRSPVKLGGAIAGARKKRRLSTVSMAERAFISRSTLAKLAKGAPTVSTGAYVTVLAILGLADGVGELAARSTDTLGLDMEEERRPRRIVPRGRRKARS